MNTIIIPQKQYQDLVNTKVRYERLRQAMEEDLFSPPPKQKISEVIEEFLTTGKYNRAFLESLKKGLARSSYFKK